MMLLTKLSTATRRARARWLTVRHRGFHAAHGAEVGRWCRIHVAPGGTVRLGSRVQLDDGVTIACYPGGVVELGDGVFVGHHSTLAAHRSLVVGAGAFLAELVSVRDHDHDPDHPPSSGATLVGTVEIGRDAWIAAKVTVLRDTVVGERAIVAANAVARGVIDPHTIVGGIPARLLRPAKDATSETPGPGDH